MIKVHDLTFAYPDADGHALKSVNFDVGEGQIFGFLGPSGAGKSTTQKLLIRLLLGYGGQISVFGRDLDEWGNDFYERIGVSFEFPNHHLKLTALENLEYFRSLYGGPVEDPNELLELVGLTGEGHKRVSQYSKGMRVRLSIARSLLNNPELLFLDEPTAGLDPVSSRSIRALIRRQSDRGSTVFLTTHNMEVADELCDEVAFLVDGEIALIDSPRELKLKYGEHKVRVEYGKDGMLNKSEFALTDLGNNAQFIELLRQESIQTIHTLETTLEEIFIRVTGHQLA
ncbi:ATP-binding cassette domain-containing protein [Candidatus Neomarinimicrobiota bacterium]